MRESKVKLSSSIKGAGRGWEWSRIIFT